MFSGKNSLASVVWVLQTGMSEVAGLLCALHPSPKYQAEISTFCKMLQPSAKLQRRRYRLCPQSFPRRSIPVTRHNNEVTIYSILSPAALGDLDRSRSVAGSPRNPGLLWPLIPSHSRIPDGGRSTAQGRTQECMGYMKCSRIVAIVARIIIISIIIIIIIHSPIIIGEINWIVKTSCFYITGTRPKNLENLHLLSCSTCRSRRGHRCS